MLAFKKMIASQSRWKVTTKWNITIEDILKNERIKIEKNEVEHLQILCKIATER